MTFRDLREFLEALRAKGELAEVSEEVSVDLELAAVLRRAMYSGGPALLFSRIREGTLPAVGNLFGAWDRVMLATDNNDPYSRLSSLLSEMPRALSSVSSGLSGLLKSMGELSRLSSLLPRTVRSGPVKEVTWDRADLSRLPAIRQWPKEPGRFLTMGLTFVEGDGGAIDFGYYRLQVIGPDRLIMHWMPWRRGAEYGSRSREVAIVFGPDPITMLMGGVPVPHPIDKAMVTGAVRGEGLELVEGETVNVKYPANAELVIEGELTGELAEEGPFGDHVGFYSVRKPYPVVRVKAIMSRRDPVIPVTVTGRPVLEDGNIIRFGERVALAMLQQLLPEVVDLYMPPEGLGYVTIVSIRKRYPGHARRVAAALWALSPLYHKVVIVVDEGVNVRDYSSVMYAVAAHVNPARDVLLLDGYPTEELDVSTPVPGLGSKACVDATRKLPEEYGGQAYPEEAAAPEDVEERARRIVEGLLKPKGGA